MQGSYNCHSGSVLRRVAMTVTRKQQTISFPLPLFLVLWIAVVASTVVVVAMGNPEHEFQLLMKRSVDKAIRGGENWLRDSRALKYNIRKANRRSVSHVAEVELSNGSRFSYMYRGGRWLISGQGFSEDDRKYYEYFIPERGRPIN